MDFFDEDEIVISGIGGHFPESDNIDELRENLMSGVDMVTKDNPRWLDGQLGVPTRLGKMKTLTKFDGAYFGLVRKQSNAMDPLTRLLLERTLEAVFDAGLNPADLKGTNTEVLFGSTMAETESLLVHSKAKDAYAIIGRFRALNANRVSYWLDLKGTSCGFDCTWNNGLQGLLIAYNHIKSGFTDAALVATASTIVYPHTSKQFADLNFLSPEGETRAFDVNANGYARAEAVVVYFIQKAKNAKRSYGTIVHVANKSMNDCERRLISSQKEEWKRLYQEFYEECKINPNEVAYLEANGIGCQESDVPEMNAAAEVFCEKRDVRRPLLIGSVKSNLGHTEASSAMSSLAKLIIAADSEKIPPNLHFRSPNPEIGALVTGKMKVVTKIEPLEGDLLALNSLGFGGTYGHLLLRKNKKGKKITEGDQLEVPRIVLVSGRTEEGVKNMLNEIESKPFDDEYIRLVHDVFSKKVVRHLYRGYTVIPKSETEIRANEEFTGAKRPVWFVFSGMGSQWTSMGRDLAVLPLFKTSIDACHEILAKKGLDLWNIITTDDKKIFDNILNCFVGIGAIQIALVNILKALGIKPDGIIGHSVGELAVGYADGCLTLEQMVLSSYYRGKASLETPTIRGMMAAVGKGYNQIKDDLPEGIYVACHNASDSCTLSGPAEEVNQFVEELKSKGVFARTVNVANIAYHSKYIVAAGPTLLQYLKDVIPEPRERSSKWFSSSVPEEEWDTPKAKYCSPEYLTNNLLNPVYFEEASKHVPSDAIIIEIAPHGLLQAILKRSLGGNRINIPLTNRTAANQLSFLLQATGKMFIAGLEPQVHNLYPDVEFPVSKGTPSLASLATWDHTETWAVGPSVHVDRGELSKPLELNFDKEENDILKGYKADGKLIIPPAKYLMMAWEILANAKSKKPNEISVTFDNVDFKKVVQITIKERIVTFWCTVQLGTGYFEIMKDDEVIVSGSLKEVMSYEKTKVVHLEKEEKMEISIRAEDVYHELLQSGHDYSEQFMNVKKISCGNNVWKSDVEWTGDLFLLLESLLQIELLKMSDSDDLHQLSFIRKLSIDPDLLPEKNQGIAIILEKRTDTLYRNGIEGFGFKFRTTPRISLKITNTDFNTFLADVPVSDKQLQIPYIEFFEKNMKSRRLGYSGMNSSGHGVMGIGSVDEMTLKIKPDEILSWPIPEDWSLEEAATVPISYTLVYYALKFLADVRSIDSVLVTNGASNLGLASIAVALECTRSVYVTVTSVQEEKTLIKKFSELDGKIIIVDEDNMEQFNTDVLMKTKGRGFNVIMSTFPLRLLETLLYLIDKFSHVFQFFEENDGKENGNNLLYGTENFALNGSLYPVTLECILNSSKDEKKLLRQFVNDGIVSGIVSPVPKVIINQQHINEYKSYKDKSEILRLDAPLQKVQKPIFDPEKSYIIIGGEVHTWLQIAKWFVKRQAKKVTIINSVNNLSPLNETKLKKLNEIAKVSLKCIQTYDEPHIRRILMEVGKVSAAVVLPIAKDEDESDSSFELLKNLDSVYQEKNSFTIAVLKPTSKGIKICMNRNQKGFPTLAVLCDSQLDGKTKGFVQIMDTLFTQKSKFVIEIIKEEEQLNANDGDIFQHLLPHCAKDAANYADFLPDDVTIKEITTLSPQLKYVKETLPIFLIPGFRRGHELLERFRKSLYPVFVVNFPHRGKSSIEEQAAYVIPKLKCTTPGPYIVIGESWGGSIAFEIGRQLENLGDSVHVFLLSGTPYEVTLPLKRLEENLDVLEMSLISKLFQIDDIEALQDISNQKSWAHRLKFCESFVKEGNKSKVIKGLDAIKWRLEGLMSYSVSTGLNGRLTIVTDKDIPSWHIKQLSKPTAEVHVLNIDQPEVCDDVVFQMIHDSCMMKVFQR